MKWDLCWDPSRLSKKNKTSAASLVVPPWVMPSLPSSPISSPGVAGPCQVAISPGRPTCPECGGRQFSPDTEVGFIVCLCGLRQTDPQASASAAPSNPDAMQGGEQGRLTSDKLEPGGEQQDGELLLSPPPLPPLPPPSVAGESPGPRSAKPAKPKPKSPVSQKQKIPKWLPEVAKRLGGVPRFVVKEARKLYDKATRDTKRQGCSEFGASPAPSPAFYRSPPLPLPCPSPALPLHTPSCWRACPHNSMTWLHAGLALASLDNALHKHQLTFTKQELCKATALGPAVKTPTVKLEQLEACLRVVQRVQRQGADEDAPLPAPLAAHFAALLCDELLQKGNKGAWAKAARAVAAHATELGIAREYSPLVLAAAANQLVFERHEHKNKVTDKKIAEEAGVDCDTMMNCCQHLHLHIQVGARVPWAQRSVQRARRCTACRPAALIPPPPVTDAPLTPFWTPTHLHALWTCASRPPPLVTSGAP